MPKTPSKSLIQPQNLGTCAPGERGVKGTISQNIIANQLCVSSQLPNARVKPIAITNRTSVYRKFSRVFGFRNLTRGKYNRIVALQYGKPIAKFKVA